MTDTAHIRQDTVEPVLDLDAMLLDLHNEFQGEPGGTTDDGTGVSDDRETPGDGTGEVGEGDGGTEAETPPETDLSEVLPPGYVKVGDEVLPDVETKALLELNRRAKDDPAFAARLRTAVLGEAPPAQEDALPAWLDPDDQQAVYFFRAQQRQERELAEVRDKEVAREQRAAQQAKELREANVRDAFREGMKEFKDDHPFLDLADLKGIADRAAAMGLLQNPEAVGGTLKGGILAAFEGAMYATPEYREKAVAGATVPTKEQRSTSRKQKSSALSSSTGSVVRTQSQEPTPTNRKEVMAQGLEFLRSGQLTD